MKYLIIDAELNGTGIRDCYNGGYISLAELSLSSEIVNEFNEWVLKYEREHYNGFKNDDLIKQLDKQGKNIALKIKKELPEHKIEYFSNARMVREII